MAIDIYASVEARLTAYIAPAKPVTAAQKQAFSDAVEVQYEHETAIAEAQVGPANAESYSASNDGVSVSVTYGASEGAVYTERTLHPYAWTLLYNAGLIRRGAIPTARRI